MPPLANLIVSYFSYFGKGNTKVKKYAFISYRIMIVLLTRLLNFKLHGK